MNWTTEDRVKYVCEVLTLDCSRNTLLPQIVETPLNYGPGVMGMYSPWTPNVVFIDSRLDDKTRLQVSIHEITHWLDAQLGLTDWSKCKTERLAFHVSNLWGLEYGGRTDWDWDAWYGCVEYKVDGN